MAANKHDWRATDADFAMVIGDGPKAARIPAQQPAEMARTEPQAETGAHEKTLTVQGWAESCKSLRDQGMGDTRLELVTSTMSTWRSNQLS